MNEFYEKSFSRADVREMIISLQHKWQSYPQKTLGETIIVEQIFKEIHGLFDLQIPICTKCGEWVSDVASSYCLKHNVFDYDDKDLLEVAKKCDDYWIP